MFLHQKLKVAVWSIHLLLVLRLTLFFIFPLFKSFFFSFFHSFTLLCMTPECLGIGKIIRIQKKKLVMFYIIWSQIHQNKAHLLRRDMHRWTFFCVSKTCKAITQGHFNMNILRWPCVSLNNFVVKF